MSSTPARVWAPRAHRVDLVLGEASRTIPMQQDGRGWWESDSALQPGTDYAFSIDGGPQRPDARSPWQPRGVQAPSRWDDRTAFDWAGHQWTGRGAPGAGPHRLHRGTVTTQGPLA